MAEQSQSKETRQKGLGVWKIDPAKISLSFRNGELAGFSGSCAWGTLAHRTCCNAGNERSNARSRGRHSRHPACEW